MILADGMRAARIAARSAEIIGAPSRRALRDDKPRSPQGDIASLV